MTETLGRLPADMARKHKRKPALLFEGRTLSFQELEDQSCKIANGLAGLGLKAGDRIALMLPNIPEFVFCFFGIQKLGAVAVPFNTLYRGREMVHILNDCEARALVTMSHFAPLINEVRGDVPSLDHVILTGQRTLIFVTPESMVSLQLVLGKKPEYNEDMLFRKTGKVLVETLRAFGVEARYKHRGGIRVEGRKIGTVTVSTVENLWVVSAICFLAPLRTDDFFQVMWVPPEVKDKIQEPSTSVEEITGQRPEFSEFRDVVFERLRNEFDVETNDGAFKRDERFGYEKARSLAQAKS